MAKRALQIALTAFNIAFFFLAVYFIFRGGAVPEKTQVLDFKDFAAILLTAVAVMLAVLGIIVGLIAVWGYKEMKQVAGSIAKEVAIQRTNEMVPGEVERVMKFKKEEGSDGSPDDIAKAYANKDK